VRNILACVVVAAMSGQVGAGVLEACGAKFLVATRSARFQRAQHTAHPAKILVYQHNADSGVIEFTSALKDTLSGVGHQVTIVSGEAALRDAARGGDFNIVMMQLDEAHRLKGDLKSWLPNASILPMGAYVTRPAAAEAKEEFGQVLTLPTKTAQLFSVVQAAYR
jgi:hypothetical protein